MQTRSLETKANQAVVAAPDTSAWLTNDEAGDLLNVSPQTLANWTRHGRLHPAKALRKDRRGREQHLIVYDPKELAKVPRFGRPVTSPREPGELAARCFELLDQGTSLRDIVIELREKPDTVRTLKENWLDMGGADFVITPDAREALARLVGSFESVAELIEQVTRLSARAESRGSS